MLASVYSYRVMVKSVSSCCVRGRRVLSNPVTYDVLKDKHPSGRAADPTLVLYVSEPSVTFHPVLFDGLDATLIRSVALQISGAAGPSGADARS